MTCTLDFMVVFSKYWVREFFVFVFSLLLPENIILKFIDFLIPLGFFFFALKMLDVSPKRK